MQVYLQLPGHNSIHHRLHRPLWPHLQSLPRHFHPRGKCREFLRKRFTFPRGSQGYRLHRPLSRYPPFPPPGESAGFFHENGSLSPVAGRGTGSTGLSGRTWHFHLRGKCRVFRRKRFTFPRSSQGHRLHRPLSPHLAFPPLGKVPGFSAKTVHFPRGSQGHRLHRPLSPHLPFPPPGKVPGFSAKTVHFPPWPDGPPAPQTSLAAPAISTSRESAGNSCENGSLSPAAGRGTGSTGISGGTRHFHLRGKCRVFLRKRFTFPRGSQGYRLHRPLWPHLAFPPPGKVPGFSAKTVHFPPWPAGAPAPQAPLAALAVSPPGESAGFSCENGSLSPVADRGTGSTGISRRTWHFQPRGKCRTFRRKRFTFPRGRQGHRLHRPLSPHLPFPPPVGKVPGFPAKTVHFPPRPAGAPAPQASLAALAIPSPGESAGFFHENGSLSPVAGRGTGSTGLSRRTCHFHLRGKCRVFPRKRFTFPRGSHGHWLHRPLSPHSPFPPLGKVPGFSTKTVHFPPRLEWQGRHRSN